MTKDESQGTVEGLLRELAPQVLGRLISRYGHFDACEDATQEALLRAVQLWPEQGVPPQPRAWLLTVASRLLIDEFRSDTSRRRREDALFAATPQAHLLASSADSEDTAADRDDSLMLLFLCCHPALTVPSQIALTLRAVGGLTTSQIAAALLVPDATMSQRITRAKATIGASGLRFEMPQDEVGDRVRAAQHVLYLIFNEGYTSSSGQALTAPKLSDEAIRLTRLLHRLLPEDEETSGLLALMLLTDSRRAARTRADGALIPLADQDRGRWNRTLIDEGIGLLAQTLPRGAVGPYQLQAAIAGVHAQAPTMADTDWQEILGLYELLDKVAPNPMTTLNRSVAVAMVHGPQAGLQLLTALASDARMARNHRLLATRAHLRELAGDPAGAASDYREAARRTSSLPERRYLTDRAANLKTAVVAGQPSLLPDDFERRIAELRIDGATAGYLRPRPIELLSRKRPPQKAIDLDVVLARSDGSWQEIDFAIPDMSAFVRDAATGELSLNGQSYTLNWLDDEESARLIAVHFPWLP